MALNRGEKVDLYSNHREDMDLQHWPFHRDDEKLTKIKKNKRKCRFAQLSSSKSDETITAGLAPLMRFTWQALGVPGEREHADCAFFSQVKATHKDKRFL
ncbi:hypothetical protein PoB_005167600 [Plakobranchus ocellatus]|uniref:Uncharacterized protein n=1 Tax=Plakobranchus ocellatus TaxID=259542 RepID=A0AAV4C1D9_9GAST|nr:hypothetical protein PoB_005167600 [Plakobranchus ocellatus]